MKIGIIGAGFTGLSAAYYLQKNGHEVTVIERDSSPGGLAIGYKERKWSWSLEKHYHHFFTNDKEILELAREINHRIIIKRPKTSVFIDNKIFQLDSPLKVLTFEKLNLPNRIRMALALGLLRYNPIWKPLEKYKTTKVLPRIMGKKAYKMLWEPQMKGKFGVDANDVSLAWFWARIKKRTTKLAYPERGFLAFAEKLSSVIIKNKGKLLYETNVLELIPGKNPFIKVEKNGKIKNIFFDKIIVTLPSSLFLKIIKNSPKNFLNDLMKRKSLGAINLVLKMNKKFMKNGTYWLSICDTTFPFMAVVEHTNFMDKKHYNNDYLVYIGKYLPHTHEYFSKDAKALLKIYDPFLRKINYDYRKNIIDISLFKAPFAQPVIPINYSKKIPTFSTPLKNVFLANIDQVYPWDRGTNYAVELGRKISDFLETK